MVYDFERFVDRSTCGSNKWEGMKRINPDIAPDVIPMSTADMEFMTAPEIQEGLKEYIDSVIQGYTSPTQSYFDAVLDWQKKRHGYEGKKNWIVTTSGVVQAIFLLVEALTEPGDGVIIQQPVYYPFAMAARLTGRRLVNNELICRENTYDIDFEDLERKAKDPKNKVLIFCNPHNPVGKVWSREELMKVVEICEANNVFIVDDEIHNDLIMPGYQHTPLPTVSEAASRICAYCTAPSKTFNLAGMQLSNIFVEDPQIRGKLSLGKLMTMSLGQVAISYEACRLAYAKGAPWLEELLKVVDGNAKYMKEFLAEHMPEAKCYPLEGTYLLWVDFRGLGLTHKEVERLMLSAQLYLDDGAMFGDAGRGFERFNLALPRKALEAAMERLLKAWKELKERFDTEGWPEHITIKEGMEFPDFTYDTPFSLGQSFAAAYKEKPVILMFHRYYSCMICNGALSKLAAGNEELEKAGIQVKVVMQSTPESVKEAMGGTNIYPFDIICDPDRVLYERFNVFTANTLFDVPGDHMQEMIPMLAGAFLSEEAPPETEGEQTQLPAWFAVDGNGIVKAAHYGKDIFDVPEIKEMAEAFR